MKLIPFLHLVPAVKIGGCVSFSSPNAIHVAVLSEVRDSRTVYLCKTEKSVLLGSSVLMHLISSVQNNILPPVHKSQEQ